MTATSTANFIVELLNKVESEAIKEAVVFLKILLFSLWKAFLPYLPYVIIIFVIIVIIAIIKAMLGQIGLLGSVIYHIFFAIILGIIVLIYGLEVLFNPFFDLIYFSIYIISYKLTGLIINKFRK